LVVDEGALQPLAAGVGDGKLELLAVGWIDIESIEDSYVCVPVFAIATGVAEESGQVRSVWTALLG